MVKLVDILKEISLEEKIVKVPQEVLSKVKKVYDYISKNIENLKSKSPKDYSHPYIDPKFKDFFKLKDLKGNDLIVTIGLYNDPKDAGAGRMNTHDDILLINLAYSLNYENLEELEDIIEHELVHAMDPKVRDYKIFTPLYTKKGAEPSGSKLRLSKSGGKTDYEKNFEKYLKSPWEFDAFTAPLINTFAFTLKKSPDYKKTLMQLLSDIKSKSVEDILKDEKYEKMPWFFSKKEWTEDNFNDVYSLYVWELKKIKIWSSKPTLYKRFLQRLAAGI